MINNRYYFNVGLLCALILGSYPAIAQQVPTPDQNIPNPVSVQPPATVTYPGLVNTPGLQSFNYIRTITPDQALTSLTSLNGVYYRQKAEYLDGLGRPLQSIAQKAHADGYDIAKAYVYDASGRESYQYLPVATPASVSDGKFKGYMKEYTSNFYNDVSDDQPYGKNKFETSPLSRITMKLPPGRSWVGSDRGVTTEYRTNTAAEGVRRFTVGYGSGDLPISTQPYAVGDLMVTKTTDEDGKFFLEYKNKTGKLILKKEYQSGSSQAHDGFACTYFVYDDLQRLRFVISPEGVANHSGALAWTISQQVADGLCYKYFYDAKGRMIERKNPGEAVEYFVYDKGDRQVMYQDGNLLNNETKWTFTAYDGLNRTMFTGFYLPQSPVSRADLQAIIDNTTTYQNWQLFYYLKNYNNYQEYPSAIGDCRILSYTYYDNYSQLQNFNFDASQFPTSNLPNNVLLAPSIRSNVTTGRITGGKVRVMNPESPGNDQWLKSVNYYDDKGRIIQTQSENHKGGVDISSNVYYFQGALFKNIFLHHNPDAQAVPGANDVLNNIVVTKIFNRNFGIGGGNDEVRRVTQQIGNGTPYNLAYYTYDQFGRPKTKQFMAGEVRQNYNIRGFLKSIEARNLNNVGDSVNIFEENLFYDKGFESKLFNGNIAGITWKKAGIGAPAEAYGYSYDNLNRLTHAEYRRYNTTFWQWLKNEYDFTASNISYDLNGNLLTMNQEGTPMAPSASPVNMDQLVYSYSPLSNQLLKVEDVAPSDPLLPDFKNGTDQPTEYTYDDNGNLESDGNKHVSQIEYSYLNKPDQITVDGEGTITYVYDANGNKLRKTIHHNSSNVTEVYDYLGQFVYKDNILQYFLNDEGRTRPIPVENPQTGIFQTRFVYDYFIKDHLENVRTTVTATPLNGEYLARHEIASAGIEQLVFDNIPNVRDFKPGSTAIDDGMAARLEGSDPKRRVGTAIMLRTMPGDRFNINVDAYYDGTTTPDQHAGPEEVISSLMGALTGGANYEGIPIAELPENARTITQALNNPALASQLNDLLNSNNNPDAPKAHLNYLFFNDKLELLPGNSGVVQVPANPMGWINIDPSMVTGSASAQVSGQIATVEPGYLIVYIDNQTLGQEVWFDNLQIGHYKGQILDENHYYPYGLTLQTSQALGAVDQPYKYQKIELERNFGLETYETFYRGLDPQLGRFNSIDPKADSTYGFSPYASMNNNPVLNIDPKGDIAFLIPLVYYAVVYTTAAVVTYYAVKETGEVIVRHMGDNVVTEPSAQPLKPTNSNVKKAEDHGTTGAAEHTSNARPSTKAKHEKANSRRQQDRQGSKGMKKYPRARPDGWKGPWPPKK